MHYIIDEINDSQVRLETPEGKFITIDTALLPKDVKEGDLLLFVNGQYSADQKATKERRQMLAKRTKNLFQKRRS